MSWQINKLKSTVNFYSLEKSQDLHLSVCTLIRELYKLGGQIIICDSHYNLEKIEYNLGGFSLFKNNTYIVQNQFDNKRTEIMLINTTKITLNVLINESRYKLKSGNSIIVDIGKKKLIKIKSNCYLLRPIIFCYDNAFLDVHHG